jgi:hypothetical protein
MFLYVCVFLAKLLFKRLNRWQKVLIKLYDDKVTEEETAQDTSKADEIDVVSFLANLSS